MIKRILESVLGASLTKTFFALFYLFCIAYASHALLNAGCLVEGQCKLHALYKHTAAFILAVSPPALAFNILRRIFWEKITVRLAAMGLISAIIYIAWEAAEDPEVTMGYMKAIADRVFMVGGLAFGFLYRALHLRGSINSALYYRKKYEALISEGK